MRYFFISFLLLLFFSVNSQVHLQTGAAEFSLPLYSYADPANRIGCDVSLNYFNGNGLKVNEVASSVGTGWGLNFGGSITRIQHGQPDDQQQKKVYEFALEYTHPDNPYAREYYPNGYLYSEFDPNNHVGNASAHVPMFDRKRNYLPPKATLADYEQDVFQFSFGGRNGEFVIGKNGSIKLIGDSNLKVQKLHDPMNANIRTTISAFVIVDENGIKYVFKDRQLSEVIKYDRVQTKDGDVISAFDFPGELDNTAIIGRATNEYVVSRWFLSEIINPLTNATILFTYDTYEIDMPGNISYQRNVLLNKAAYTLILERRKGLSKRIVRITNSHKEKVEFYYSALPRQDNFYDKALDKIKVFYDGVVKTEWQFNMGYTGRVGLLPITYTAGTLETDQNKPFLRLCLFSIQKKGAGDLQEGKYEFQYNLGRLGSNNDDDLMPASFSIFHDQWGYSNATEVFTSPYPDYGNSIAPIAWQVNGKLRSFHELLATTTDNHRVGNKEAQKGILKLVKYPAGGILSFEYEQNDVDYGGMIAIGGVRVAKTSLYDGFDHAKDVIKTYQYKKLNGSSSGWGYEAPVYTQDQIITVQARTSDHSSGLDFGGVVSSIPSFAQILTSGNSVKLMGEDMIGEIGSIATGMAYQLIISMVYNILGADSTRYATNTTFSDPLNGHNLLPFQYQRVEVTSLAQVNIGKTVYEFTSPEDPDNYSIRVATLGFPYSNETRTSDWTYGLLKNKYVLDNNNQVKQQTTNVYKYYVSEFKNPAYRSQKWAPNHTNFRAYRDFENQYLLWDQYGQDLITSKFYYPLAGHTDLSETKEYNYNSNGTYVLSSTKYDYNANYLVSKIETTNSKGELLQTNTYYPNDYALAGAIKTMQDSNMIDIPVSVQTFRTTSQGKKLIDGSVNEYDVISNGDIKVVRNYSFQSPQPVSPNTVSFSGSSLIPNTQYYKKQQEIKYNSAGLPEQVEMQNMKTAKLYGYDNKLVIADIYNAGGAEAFFDSFEEPGIWNGIGYDNSKIHTGKFSGKIENWTETKKGSTSSKWLTLTLTQPTKFKISGWVYCDGPDGDVAVGMQTNAGQISYIFNWIHVANKWVYLEQEFTVPANVTKLFIELYNYGHSNVGGNVWFDDIRLHPSNAWMTTYTYDPLIGLLSTTDASNRSVFSEYDGLGRLSHVMDNEHNILKKYCYTYAGQPESCPAYTVGNLPQSKGFQKNNCDAANGYYGTQVTYTIPASRYFSTTQSFADGAAQAALNNEGQNFANINGGCIAGEANDLRMVMLTRNNCTYGKTGEQLTYTVPAGKYAAATKAAANQLADADVNNNGQAYVNEHGYCLYFSDVINANFYSQVCASNQVPVPYLVSIPAGSYFNAFSKSDANWYAQNAAQYQANTFGQCTNTTALIYARLEVEPSFYNNSTTYDPNSNSTTKDQYQQVAMYLRFYSDAACTQHLALPKAVNYSVNSSGMMFEHVSNYRYSYNNIAYQGTAPVGVTEVFFDDILAFESSYIITNGNGEWTMFEESKSDYDLGVCDGCTVQPRLYPGHTPWY